MMGAAIRHSVGAVSAKTLSALEAVSANPGERAALDTRTCHRSNTLVHPWFQARFRLVSGSFEAFSLVLQSCPHAARRLQPRSPWRSAPEVTALEDRKS